MAERKLEVVCRIEVTRHAAHAAAAVFDIFEIGKDFVSGCHAFAQS